MVRSNEKSCGYNVFATPHSKNPVKSNVLSYQNDNCIEKDIQKMYTNPGKHWFSGAFLYVIICSYFCAILLLNSRQINPDWRDCGEKMFEIFQVYFYISLRQIVHSTDQHGHGLTRSCPSNREDR